MGGSIGGRRRGSPTCSGGPSPPPKNPTARVRVIWVLFFCRRPRIFSRRGPLIQVYPQTPLLQALGFFPDLQRTPSVGVSILGDPVCSREPARLHACKSLALEFFFVFALFFCFSLFLPSKALQRERKKVAGCWRVRGCSELVPPGMLRGDVLHIGKVTCLRGREIIKLRWSPSGRVAGEAACIAGG